MFPQMGVTLVAAALFTSLLGGPTYAADEQKAQTGYFNQGGSVSSGNTAQTKQLKNTLPDNTVPKPDIFKDVSKQIQN